MTGTTITRPPRGSLRGLSGRISLLQDDLGDRLHSAAHDEGRDCGWTVVTTSSRLGFVGQPTVILDSTACAPRGRHRPSTQSIGARTSEVSVHRSGLARRLLAAPLPCSR